jgi:alanyl aminopeptidase
MGRRWFVLTLLAAAACTSEPLPPPPPPHVEPPPGAALAESPTPPLLRLPRNATPTRYKIALTLKPSETTFQGEATIELDVVEPASVLWLNATALTVISATVEYGHRPFAARVIGGGEEFVGFALPWYVPAGPVRLVVKYTGTISDKNDHGIFVEEEDKTPYVFTQFETLHARRAFPCFDEPSYKVPWQLTLRVPEADVALSNTPVASETRDPATGMKTVTFAETAPLPSYLVAFAVGPFDLVDAGKAGKKGTPVRIVTPKGQASQAATAAAVTPVVLARLEDYTGIPYPYEKLDIVAVPRLVTFGAMENVGLVTFNRFGLLARKDEQTVAFEIRLTATMAHELGHQWFGDLVTTAWWDDTWLNEGFASWVEAKVLVPWKPAWHYELGRARSTGRAMATDALASVRRVRQSITTVDDIHNAFDDITYSKGAAVIGMVEAYVGEARFQKALHRYLTERANKTATAGDLFSVLGAEVGHAVPSLFSSFVDQPGVPLVSATLRCDNDKASVRLAQSPYRPAGSDGRGAALWEIPVCVRYGRGKSEGRACTLLADREATLALPALPEAKGCPEWLVPNDGGHGYYHARYDRKSIEHLLHGAGKLSLLERVALVRDMRALVASGELPVGDALAFVPDLLRDPRPQVLRSALDLVSVVSDSMLSPEERARFARFVSKTLGPRAHALGWQGKPHEDEEMRLLRPGLLSFVADRGEDAKLGAEAEAIAARWLEDPKAVDQDTIDAVLEIAAQRGGRAFFDRVRGLAKTEKDDLRKRRLLNGMARSRDPKVVADSLGILLTDEHESRNALGLLWQDGRMADVTFAFVKEHFDELLAKLPHGTLGNLSAIGDAFCDEARGALVTNFFAERVDKLPGGKRNLAKTVERIRLCSAQKAAQEGSLRKFLERY